VRCGVYVHIPYCSQRCGYCAFHSTTDWTHAAQRALIEKIIRDAEVFSGSEPTAGEVDRESGFVLPPIEAKTLYIGGGTPSTLARGQISRLVNGLTTALGDPAEITCEANPESADTPFLEEAAAAGVTRLSVGVQSLSPRLCSVIGRRPTHLSDLARIRSCWPGLLSADLIIGIPGQTTKGVADEVSKLADIGFSHLSIYDLSVEPETPFARRVASGGAVIPEGGPNWEVICESLGGFGFSRYEISNFALPGRESLHNLGYWRMEPYLGLGPSAASTLPANQGSVRFVQTTNHAEFLRGHPFGDANPEHLDSSNLITEYLMLGLRITEGVRLARLAELLNADPEAILGDRIDELVNLRFLVRDGDSWRPTSRGMDFLNQILVELLGALNGLELPNS